jgi:hypothetical protein
VEDLSIPDETHEALDAHTDPCRRVGFSYRNINQHRTFQDLFHDLHTFQNLSLRNLDLAENFLSWSKTWTPGFFTRFPNPCSLKTKFCPMEGMI